MEVPCHLQVWPDLAKFVKGLFSACQNVQPILVLCYTIGPIFIGVKCQIMNR